LDKALLLKIVTAGPRLTWVLGLALLAWLAFRTGVATGYYGFISADTCWLLKMGQIIAETGVIPRSDPFSFSLAMAAFQGHPRPFVPYQWLAELVFFMVYRSWSFYGLLAFSTAVVALAYLAFPLRNLLALGAPTVWSLLAVGATSMASTVRFQVRPEIFSVLFLSVWLLVLSYQRKRLLAESQEPHLDFRFIGMTTLTIMIWCNLHSGFVCAIAILLIYSVAFVLHDQLLGRPLSYPTKTILVTFLSSSLATLFNPHGFELWSYLPGLFFSPVNDTITELRSLQFPSLFTTARFPFLVLLVLCYGGIAFRAYRTQLSVEHVFKSPTRMASLVIVLLATILCFYRVRLISIASLLIMVESAYFIAESNQTTFAQSPGWIKKAPLVVLELAILALAYFGLATTVRPSSNFCIPTPTQAFSPPLNALNVFHKTYSGGRVFASAEISDMLDLYMNRPTPIFLDTRYDAFGVQLCQEYQLIDAGLGDFNNLLDSYKIEWIFVKATDPIGRVLESNPEWLTVYKDETARLLKRRLKIPGTKGDPESKALHGS
jgi:hypothetical protein